MAKMSIDQLTSALRQDEYVAKTDEQLRAEAEKRVGETYDTMRGAAQQRQATIDEAYARELQSLEDSLAKGTQAISQEVGRANANIDKYVNTRSMQRTSYSAGSKGSIYANMMKAAEALRKQYDTASSGIENSRVLLAEQLAGTLAQYDKDYLTDVEAYINEQKQLDYDRKVAADEMYNQLQTQLFELGKSGSGGGGGGYRRYGSGSTTSPTTSNKDVIGMLNQYSGAKPNAGSQQASMGVNPTFGKSNQNTSGGKILDMKSVK